jgi:hypothetical protein
LLQHLRSFWAKSINSGAFAIGTLILVAVLQQLLAQDLAQGTGRTGRDLYRDVALLFSDLWGITKFILVIPTLFFWLLNRVRPYYLSMLLTMVMITFELVVNVLLLVADPVVNSWQSGYFLARDNVLLALINLHVFALWYYIIEGPIARKALQVDEQRWDFLFPQRASHIPGYEAWTPHFIDYWFLAMVTIVTFGPADTLPLSRRAKLLMALEIVISVLTITVLVGRALSAT